MKNLKFKIVILVIGLFSLNISSKAMMVYPETYSGFGITGNLQGFQFYSWGIGVGYNSILTWSNIGMILKAEFERTPSVNMNAIKFHLGGYIFERFIMIYVGIGETNYKREGTPYLSIRPEIGYGVGFCQITYGRNIADVKAHQWIPKNTITLGFYIPIKNKTSSPFYWN